MKYWCYAMHEIFRMSEVSNMLLTWNWPLECWEFASCWVYSQTIFVLGCLCALFFFKKKKRKRNSRHSEYWEFAICYPHYPGLLKQGSLHSGTHMIMASWIYQEFIIQILMLGYAWDIQNVRSLQHVTHVKLASWVLGICIMLSSFSDHICSRLFVRPFFI